MSEPFQTAEELREYLISEWYATRAPTRKRSIKAEIDVFYFYACREKVARVRDLLPDDVVWAFAQATNSRLWGGQGAFIAACRLIRDARAYARIAEEDARVGALCAPSATPPTS